MKKITKLFLLAIITLVGVTTLAGCKAKYKYPTIIPTITNPDETYLSVGDYKVTKKQMYYRTIVSYGVDCLNTLIDDMILPQFSELTADEQANYSDYREKVIYNTDDVSLLTEEEKTDLLKDFEKNMALQGIFDDADVDKYLKLDYRRYVYSLRSLKAEVDAFEPIKDDNGNVVQEEYFTETDQESVKNSLYPDTATIILLTFRSEVEAKSVMEKAGIYTDNYDYRGWRKLVIDGAGNKTAGELLTEQEIYDAYITMYNEIYNQLGCSINPNTAYKLQSGDYVWNLTENANGYNNFTYTYSTLSNISSVIAKKVFDSLDAEDYKNSYTIAPNKYLTKYFLTIKLAEKIVSESNQDDKEIMDKLLENKLTTAMINYYLYTNRLAADLTIYDRGLEISYASSVATAYTNVSKEYEGYDKTNDTSATNIATVTVDGKKVDITVDQLYDELVGRNGLPTSVGFMNQYILLGSDKYEDVFNFVTNKIINQESYDALYEEEIGTYKKELEAGTFDSLGYPKSYGWENFLRDRFGVLAEIELIGLGTVYDNALEAFGKAQYTFSNDASNAINDLFAKFTKGEITRTQYNDQIKTYQEAANNTIQYQMQKIVDDFYSVNAYTINAYVDFDHNDSADELVGENATNQEVYSKLLVNYFLNKANDATVKGSDYYERLSNLVKEYNLSAFDDQTIIGDKTVTFGLLKKLGIEVSLTTSTTYTSSVTNDENVGTIIKDFWNDVKDGKISGKNYSTSTTNLSFTNELISDFYEHNNVFSKIVVVKTTDYTYVANTTSKKQILPTEELIERYNIVNKADEDKTDEELELSLTTKEKTALETYYTVALDALINETILGEELVNVRDDMLSKGTMSFADAKNNEYYELLIDYLTE